MNIADRIEEEWIRLYSLKGKELEIEVGRKIAHEHLGRESLIMSHLIDKFGLEAFNAWMERRYE